MNCPHCSGKVQRDATRCKHCKEEISGDGDAFALVIGLGLLVAATVTAVQFLAAHIWHIVGIVAVAGGAAGGGYLAMSEHGRRIVARVRDKLRDTLGPGKPPENVLPENSTDAGRVAPAVLDLSKANCPYCGKTVRDCKIVVCQPCQTPHHSDCWTENGGRCTTYGCSPASGAGSS